jgi:hypothetical protein
MTIPAIYQQWNDEAAQAIMEIDPSAAPVIRTISSFELWGRKAPIRVWLDDGSQWIIEDGKARKLSDEEIAESLRVAQSYAGEG